MADAAGRTRWGVLGTANIAAKANRRQSFQRTVLCIIAVHMLRLGQTKCDILPDRLGVEQRAALKHHADLWHDAGFALAP